MYKIEVAENISQEMRRLGQKMRDMSPLMSLIGRSLASRTQLGFRLGVDPYGEAWAPLKFRQGQPLRDTGRLQRSITSVAGSDYVDVGTNVSYGLVHQFGATIEAGKPPHISLGGYQTTGSPVLLFRGPGGKTVAAKKVVIPARPILPTAKLPSSWGTDTVNAIRSYLGGK